MKTENSNRKVFKNRSNKHPYALLMPAVIAIILFQLLPLLQAIYVSFVELKPKTWNTFFTKFQAPFVGFDNYKWVLTGANGTMKKALYDSVNSTLIYVSIVMIVTLALGMIIALALNRKFKLSGVARSLLLLPFIMPGFAVSTAWETFFAEKTGLINRILVDWLHLMPQKVDWYHDKRILFVLIVMSIWHYLPLSILFLLSGLQNISKECYEAADIDGAGHIKKFMHITIPLLRPVIAILIFLGAVLHVYYSYKVLEWDMIMYFLYRHFFRNWFFSLGTAGVIMVMISMIIFILLWYLFFRKDFSGTAGKAVDTRQYIEKVKVYGIADKLEDILIAAISKLGNILRIRTITGFFSKVHSKLPKWDYLSFIVWPATIVLGFMHLTSNIGHETLWFDESCSAAAIKHSITDIWHIASGDVHPPLYFIMLKFFTMMFGQSESALRLLSAIGILCISLLGLGPVRRAFDKFTGMIFAFIVLIVPMSLSMGQEARMYTWSAFFVTASVLYGYLSADRGKVGDFIKFGLFTLAAAYTHYYSLLAVAIANALILVYLIKVFDKKKFIAYIITASAVVIGYIPWLMALMGQLNTVSRDFWITEVNGGVIWDALIYPFRAKFWSNYDFTIPSFVGIAILVFTGIRHAIGRKRKEGLLSVFSISVYILTLTAGIIASKLYRPVFVDRYIFPVVGLFLLSAAYGIARLKYKDMAVFVVMILMVFSLEPIVEINKQNFNGPMAQVTEYVNEKLGPDDAFVHIDEHTFGMFTYYFPDNKHYFYLPEGANQYNTYEAFSTNGMTGTDIDGFLKGKGKVWVVTRQSSYLSRYIYESVLKERILDNELVYIEKPRTFRVDYSFYVFDVSYMEYNGR